MKNYLLGCDWGTTSFRLRLVNTQNQQPFGEITSPDGVASTFTAWQKNGAPVGITQEQFFRQQLKKQLDRLAQKLDQQLNGIPVVISGMASSSIGMQEVPYAQVPFPTDGSRASVKRIESRLGFPHDIFLVSGVCTDHDVMRGEETQLIGLLALADSQIPAGQDAVLLFPGTHSKHIYVRNEQVIDFKTFMTGEVFSLMAKHSILSDSIDHSRITQLSAGDINAFTSGVREGSSDAFLSALFTVRANQLFNKLTKRQNAHYLSGLLIGSELASLMQSDNWPLILCCGPNLHEPYSIALRELELLSQTTIIPVDLFDKITIAGQVKLAGHQLIPTHQ